MFLTHSKKSNTLNSGLEKLAGQLSSEAFIMTRILSVFNLLKRVGFAVLVLGTITMRYTILVFLLAVCSAFAQEVLWQRDGELSTSRFGSGVYSIGDQNDDGYSDWAVFQSIVGSLPPESVGLEFFYGGNPPSQDSYLSIRGREGTPPLYWRSHDFGDFNGDGYIDWVVTVNPGAPAPADSMYFYFYSGGPNADTIPELIWGVDGFDFFVRTSRLFVIGDHNGDGKDDFYYYDPYPLDLVYIYFGDSGWNFEVGLINQGEPLDSGESVPSSRAFGDFNGDGFDDYPTRYEWVTKFYWGGAEPDTLPDFVLNRDVTSHFSMSVDLNMDGYDELISDLGFWGVDVFLGRDVPSQTPDANLVYQAGPEWQPGDNIRSAGDVNHDGYEDFVVVNSSANNGFGKLAIFGGGPYIRETPIWVEDGAGFGLLVGIKQAVGVGDINGDGIDDLAIGCQLGNNLRGRVVIFSGDSTLFLPVVERLPITQDFSISVFPNPANGVVNIAMLARSGFQQPSVEIYNLLGQHVDRLVVHDGLPLRYDVSGLATGVYFIHADIGREIVTQKFVVLK